ncbi:MAG: phosphodiester glycosidase family protein [Paludibacter sp.]|nr:phosphodiester glycosidase family protein [Paludibacter sp.]
MKEIKLYFLLAFVIGLFACEEPETQTVYEAIPKTETGAKLVNGTDLFAYISTDTTYTVTSGVVATEIKYLSMKGLSMKIFIFEVDLTNPAISIEASSPNNQNVFAMQPMTVQATFADQPGNLVYGGINGDFYNMTTGQPRSIFYKKGVAVKTAFQDDSRTFFAITNDKKAMVGDGTTYPAVQENIKEAVGGLYWLVSDSILIKQTDTSVEPRTCIGVSKDQKKVYMMAVDGRNFWYSNGMNFEELAKCMMALGAYNSVNLDGGGSTTFFIRNTPDFTDDRFEIRNWPSDNGGAERAVANGLLIISGN